MLMREGTVVDATVIAAPPSNKNRAKAQEYRIGRVKKSKISSAPPIRTFNDSGVRIGPEILSKFSLASPQQ